jgi:hypothetical protein
MQAIHLTIWYEVLRIQKNRQKKQQDSCSWLKMTHRCAIWDSKQRRKDDKKMTDGYTEEDLHQCCAVECREAGKHLLILKQWTGTQY